MKKVLKFSAESLPDGRTRIKPAMRIGREKADQICFLWKVYTNRPGAVTCEFIIEDSQLKEWREYVEAWGYVPEYV